MNRIVHLVVKYLYALFLLGSGVKHLYNIYWADASIMATGYPEPEAQAFVTAVLATKFLLPFICTAKLLAGVLIVLPVRIPAMLNMLEAVVAHVARYQSVARIIPLRRLGDGINWPSGTQ